jgi:hypothetical protein
MMHLATSLINDLLDDDHLMLANKEEPLHAMSIFIAPDANDTVKKARRRIIDTLQEELGDRLWSAEYPYINMYGNAPDVEMHNSTMVLVLFYKKAAQRVLVLTLSTKTAKLHFLK